MGETPPLAFLLFTENTPVTGGIQGSKAILIVNALDRIQGTRASPVCSPSYRAETISTVVILSWFAVVRTRNHRSDRVSVSPPVLYSQLRRFRSGRWRPLQGAGPIGRVTRSSYTVRPGGTGIRSVRLWSGNRSDIDCRITKSLSRIKAALVLELHRTHAFRRVAFWIRVQKTQAPRCERLGKDHYNSGCIEVSYAWPSRIWPGPDAIVASSARELVGRIG